MTTKAKLFLIPTTIATGTENVVIPLQVTNELRQLKHFLAENIRSARRYLSSLKVYESIEELHFYTLDKDTKEAELQELLQPLEMGQSMGVVSESGCPGIADPGELAVAWAHRHNFQVVPLVGPSSILLALMSSGLGGQRFRFHGYLPVKKTELTATIRRIEKESKNLQETQLFIETPYRNNSLINALIENLAPQTLLCVASDLTGAQEKIETKSISDWKKSTRSFEKVPTIFLLQGR